MTKNRIILLSLAAVALLATTVGALLYFEGSAVTLEQEPVLEPIRTPETSLVFVGDIMLSRSVGARMEAEGDWRWPFLPIAEYLRGFDITFGNLETTISDRGVNVGSIYSFRADPRSVEGLVYAGFDALSVANNHMGDWSQVAMEDTFALLQKANIAVVGGGYSEEEAHTARTIERNGTRFGLLGYTDLGARYTEALGDEAGIAWLDKEQMVADIETARTTHDVVIVSVHMGEEYSEVTARQRDIAHAAIDAGAALFIGHHPHVVQEVEHYNGGVIAYSLGNFIFDQTFSKETMSGLALVAVFEGSTLSYVEEVPIDISRAYQASLAR